MVDPLYITLKASARSIRLADSILWACSWTFQLFTRNPIISFIANALSIDALAVLTCRALFFFYIAPGSFPSIVTRTLSRKFIPKTISGTDRLAYSNRTIITSPTRKTRTFWILAKTISITWIWARRWKYSDWHIKRTRFWLVVEKAKVPSARIQMTGYNGLISSIFENERTS